MLASARAVKVIPRLAPALKTKGMRSNIGLASKRSVAHPLRHLFGMALLSRPKIGTMRSSDLERMIQKAAEPLIMHKSKSKYGAVYEARRVRTQVTHPDWWCDRDGALKVDKSGKPTSAHGSADAARVMTKELISDLWSEWRRSEVSVDASPCHEVADVPRLVAAE